MELMNSGTLTGGEEMVLQVNLKNAAIENVPNLEMILVTSSINHEYTRQELERETSYPRQQELLSRLDNLRLLYDQARQTLWMNSPEKLTQIEADLLLQKQTVLNEYPI